MPLCTRLDGRSVTNNMIYITDATGKVVAEVRVVGKSANLEVSTKDGYKVLKPKEGIENE